jgi:hypothetical protein
VLNSGFCSHYAFLVQESILDYNNEVQPSLVSKAFLGAASASKGKRLDLFDRVIFLLLLLSGCIILIFSIFILLFCPSYTYIPCLL